MEVIYGGNIEVIYGSNIWIYIIGIQTSLLTKPNVVLTNQKNYAYY